MKKIRLNDRMWFGKYNGMRMCDLLSNDLSYVDKLLKEENVTLDAKCMDIFERKTGRNKINKISSLNRGDRPPDYVHYIPGERTIREGEQTIREAEQNQNHQAERRRLMEEVLNNSIRQRTTPVLQREPMQDPMVDPREQQEQPVTNIQNNHGSSASPYVIGTDVAYNPREGRLNEPDRNVDAILYPQIERDSVHNIVYGRPLDNNVHEEINDLGGFNRVANDDHRRFGGVVDPSYGTANMDTTVNGTSNRPLSSRMINGDLAQEDVINARRLNQSFGFRFSLPPEVINNEHLYTTTILNSTEEIFKAAYRDRLTRQINPRIVDLNLIKQNVKVAIDNNIDRGATNICDLRLTITPNNFELRVFMKTAGYGRMIEALQLFV